MIPLSFSFLKSQRTVGELRKLTREAQSPLNFTKGDKFVARQEIKHPQGCDKVFHTSFLRSDVSDDTLHNSLMPRTSDLLSQININKCKNTRTAKADVFRNLGIEVL